MFGVQNRFKRIKRVLLALRLSLNCYCVIQALLRSSTLL